MMNRRTALYALPAAAAFPALAAEPETEDPAVLACQRWYDAELAYSATFDRMGEMEKPPVPREHLATVADAAAPGGKREIYAYDLSALTPAAEKKGAFIGRDFAGEMPEAERREKYERLSDALDEREQAVRDAAGVDIACDAADKARQTAIATRATTLAGVQAKVEAAVRGNFDADGTGPECVDGTDMGRIMASIADDLRSMKNTPPAA